MYLKLEREQVLRFVNLKPIVEGDILFVTRSKDFSDFLNYLVLRRDKEECCKDELGRLAMLHTAFQKVIEAEMSY